VVLSSPKLCYSGGGFWGFRRGKKAQTIRRAMLLAALWVMWNGRNHQIFEESEMVVEDLFEKANYLASLWAATYVIVSDNIRWEDNLI